MLTTPQFHRKQLLSKRQFNCHASLCGVLLNGRSFNDVFDKNEHEDHRDANASFNIGARGKRLYKGITDNERELSAGLIDDHLTGKGVVV